MKQIFISGLGAVSPAGWGVAALCAALNGATFPAGPRTEFSDRESSLRALRAPPLASRPSWAAHPRLRRASAISRFAMGASVEALNGRETNGRLGIVFCTTCGGVGYSRRFYDEALRDPETASPLLFPETVFNAPAGHLSSVLDSAAINYTLAGDSGVFLHGLALAADWLLEARVDACVVVAAEEADWIIADVLRHFRKSVTLGEGAGAVLLTREREANSRAVLERVTDSELVTPPGGKSARADAERRVVAALPPGPVTFPDAARLGEAFAAGAAWSVVAALETARRQRLARAIVCVPGAYQEAVGASFSMLGPEPT